MSSSLLPFTQPLSRYDTPYRLTLRDLKDLLDDVRRAGLSIDREIELFKQGHVMTAVASMVDRLRAADQEQNQ